MDASMPYTNEYVNRHKQLQSAQQVIEQMQEDYHQNKDDQYDREQKQLEVLQYICNKIGYVREYEVGNDTARLLLDILRKLKSIGVLVDKPPLSQGTEVSNE